MGIKNNCVKTVTVELKTIDQKYVDELTEKLKEEFSHGDWEYDTKGDWYVITCMESGSVTYYPGKLYTSNGDGYPDEYDEDFEIYADDVESEIEKYASEHYEDVITDWKVSEEVEYAEEDYYDEWN